MDVPWKQPAISYPDVFSFGQCHCSKSNNGTLFPWHSSSDILVTTLPYLWLCCSLDEYHIQNDPKQIKAAKLVNPSGLQGRRVILQSTLKLHSFAQVPCNSQEQLKQLAMPRLRQKTQTPGKESIGKLYNTEPLT